jgi:exopolysaccharide biosynthesis operon protein EpsL
MVRPAASAGFIWSHVALPAFCALTVAALSAQSARADEFDTFNFVTGSRLRYESNILQSPDFSIPPPGVSSKADTYNVSYIGLRVDKPVSLQRFQLSATDTTTHYSSYTFLDNNALDYHAAWLYSITPHVTGSLSSDRTQAQIPFALIGGAQRNIVTTNSRNFTIDVTGGGVWHLLGGLGTTDLTTEQQQLTVPPTRSRRYEGGIRYLSNAGNSVTAIYRHIPAELIGQALDPRLLIDTNYRDSEAEVRAEWQVTGLSRIEARLMRKQRTNEHFTQRDFSGTTGEARYSWTPTGKLKFSFAATRDLVPYAAFGNVIENSTYRVDDTLSVVSIWEATAKINVQATLLRTESDFRGPVFPITGPVRADTLTLGRLKADWAITRFATLTAILEHDRRASNVPGFQFTNTIVSVGAALTF